MASLLLRFIFAIYHVEAEPSPLHCKAPFSFLFSLFLGLAVDLSFLPWTSLITYVDNGIGECCVLCGSTLLVVPGFVSWCCTPYLYPEVCYPWGVVQSVSDVGFGIVQRLSCSCSSCGVKPDAAGFG
ncbi:hypothetical protein N665_0051s0010 [Sinapis alba]|nr:hypothetical protein N665_0051s0010 [Sinapis alba]